MNEPLQMVSFTIGIPVDDVERASTWYRQLLGPCQQLDPVPGIREFALAPSLWLQLIETPTVPAQSILRIGVANAQQEYQRIQQLATEVSPLQEVPGVLRFFEFKDPFGNALSFYEELAREDPL